MKIAIFPNLQKENALECSRTVCDVLHQYNMELYIDNKYYEQFEDKGYINFGMFEDFVKESEIAIAIGGDGTILKCARYLLGIKTKLLGINTGRLGFMASLEFDELAELHSLIKGDYDIIKRMMLATRIYTGENYCENIALNDVSIARLYSKLSDFKVYVDDNLIGTYRADGIVISTPTGSTAYALSAGGPIIEPSLDCIELTLLCPHSLFSRPMLFSPDRVIKIVHNVDVNPELYISIDGNDPITFNSRQVLEVKKSAHKINLIDMKRNTFFDSLNKKLMRSIKGN
ncbi:MAG: NAD(+)/NADH kinase [Clostridiales bacterium]|nr:NAD(+)/NADH kinase [Clostridiales bacterium]